MHIAGEPGASLHPRQVDLRAVYDHVPVMVCVLDADRRLEYANQALCRFVGSPEQVLRGDRACGMLGCINSLDDPRGCGYGPGCESCTLRQAILDTFSTGEAHRDVDYRATLERDGRREDKCFLGATSLLTMDGRRSLVLCLEDITRQRKAEELHQQSEEQYRRLLDASPCAILVVQDGRYAYGNPYALERFGYSADELRQIPVLETVHPDSREQILQRLAAIGRGEANAPIQVKLLRKGGEVMDHESQSVPIVFDGRPAALVIGLEVTERKRAEERIRRLAELLDASPTSITVHDPRGHFLYANEKTFALHGYSREEFFRLNLRQLDVPASAEQIEARMAEISERGAASFDVQHYRKDGTLVPLRVDARSARWDGERVILSVATDVSDLRRIQDALRDREARLRSILDAVSESVFLIDLDGIVLECNETTAGRLGTSAAELRGRCIYDFVAAESAQARRQIVQRVLQTRQPVHFEDQRAGIWFEHSVYPAFDERGNLVQIAVFGRDVTARKETERSLRQSEQQSRELERRLLQTQKLESLSVLAGGIAHDFNNILAVIRGYAELIQLSLSPTASAQNDLETIKQSVERATKLTRQMLAYSGKGSFRLEQLNLSRLVADCQSLVASCVSKNAVVTYDLPLDVPDIQADPAQMRQLLMSLVTNASEALGEHAGQVAISTRTVQASAEELAGLALNQDLPAGPCVCLKVADTGCGMDEQTLAKVFDPFFSTKFTGRGLGLPAVHGIVRGHRGAIGILSRPGQGTTFRVLFPPVQT